MEFSYIQTRPVLSSSVRFGSWRARCVQFSVVVDRRRHTGLRPCPSVPDKAMTCRRRRRRRSVSPATRQSNGIARLVRKPARRGIVDCRTVAIIFTYLRAQSRASRRAGRRRRRARVQIATVTLSGNSLRQRVAGVTAGLADSNGSLPPGL